VRVSCTGVDKVKGPSCSHLRVNAFEPVTTTTVHLSEVAKVLEDAAGISFAGDFLSALLQKPIISVEAVLIDDFRESILFAKKSVISINDALAIIFIKRQGID
jgi:hypothetical protein